MAGIIKDSSVWQNDYSFDAATKKDMSIRVGMVREELFEQGTQQTKYVVEVFDKTNQIPVLCTRLDRFGGAFNFEEYVHRVNKTQSKNLSSGSKYSVRAGDVVLIAFANGDSREGFILGGVKHPARKEKNGTGSGIAYNSEFNGVQTSINKDGEYKITFRGVPTNISALEKPSGGNDIPTPTYNDSVGTSFFEFDKTGSWKLTDSAKAKPQSIKIDKPGGKIEIKSGEVTITMDKNAQLISVVTKDLKIDASQSIKETTKEWSMVAATFSKIKSPKRLS